ncbi:MAG: hypothetical protein AAGA23_23440 [Pseudomonadota bacterium]
MIENRFGSYGIQVLQQTSAQRVSDLFSGSGLSRTTRTLALVNWPEQVPEALAAPHGQILDGASLGATLRAAGWMVQKYTLTYSEIPAPPWLARRMKISAATPVALHLYSLSARRGDAVYYYVDIAELHHPDYLTLERIPGIFGEPTDALTPAERRRKIKTIAAELTRFQDPAGG